MRLPQNVMTYEDTINKGTGRKMRQVHKCLGNFGTTTQHNISR